MRLKFWFWQALQNTLAVLLACSLFSFLMFLQTDSGWEGLVILLPIYLLVFGAMMMIALSIGIYKMTVPLVLSFGSTRNEVLVGLQINRLLPTVLITGITTLLCLLFPSSDSLTPDFVLPVGFGLFLLAGGVGSILGAVFTKYGRSATVISVLLFIAVGFGAGFAAAFLDDTASLPRFLSMAGLRWLAVGIGLIVYGISMIPEHRTVRNCNVKL